MAQTACIGQQSSIHMAEGGKFHQRDQHRRSDTQINRQRKAEPERIRELYREKRNGHEVARLLRLGHTTVYKYLALDNPPKPRWTDDENQIMVDGYLAGLPAKKIAEKLKRRSLLP